MPDPAAIADYLMGNRILGTSLRPQKGIVMATVEARFYVSEVTKRAYGSDPWYEIKLQAVSRGEHNKVWASATPSGTISMTVNPGAAKMFDDLFGKDLAVTFREVPEPGENPS